MKLIVICFVATVSTVLVSCGTVQPRYASSYPTQYVEKEPITRSLFDDKDRTISEEDIQRLLSGTIKLPDTLRIAIFKYDNESVSRYYTHWWTDEEYMKTQQSFADTLMQPMTLAPNVKKVIPVPTLMTTQNPTMTQLRETAVRLQADLLVVYRVTSDIYYKYKVFNKDEAKAFATCEAIIIDIRTGVVPFTSIITRDKMVVKQKEDLSDSETRKRAEHDAVLLSLVETGKRITDFLKK